MRRRIATLAAVSVFALALGASPALAGTPAEHFRSMPAGGMTFDCGSTSIQTTSGTMDYITRSADTVVVASVDRVIWRAPGRPWNVERVISPSIGTVFALQGDTAGVWIGGARGLAFYRYRTRDYQIFNSAGDIPGAIHGLALSGPYLWVATDRGLVRFLKRTLMQ